MPAGNRAPFISEKLIRFHHCDPTGIVFYPQYFILFHELLEDWFNHGLAVDYADFVSKERRGLPTVHIDCDFRIPNQRYLKFQLLRAAASSFCVGYPRMALIPPRLRSV